MDPKYQAVWFGLALACFLITAFWGWGNADGSGRGPIWRTPNLLALGLAFFTIVFFWQAFRAI